MTGYRMTHRPLSYPCLSFIALILALGLLVGCGGSEAGSQQADVAAQANSIVPDTIGVYAGDSVPGVQAPYVYRDTIVGKFVKSITDTLVIESGGDG